MRLTALFSGGKDSAFATYLASQMGHDIVSIVSIKSEKDSSWIFHTPNQDIVQLMAESMAIPFVTAKTDGSEDGDVKALKNALQDLDVEGVVTGAIWSDYQWDRINSVLGELNLTMIAPLWRKDQDMIYDEMVSSGVDAIIIGVFADGLDEKWLGRKLDQDAKKELVSLRKKHGISIMGEGGEYESITLDSPMFRKRLEIVSSEKSYKKGSGTMNVTEARLVSK